MTAGQHAFLADLQESAHAAQSEEIRFRKSIAAEIAAREQARAFAFRRLGLMRAMVAAASEAETIEAARAAQARALSIELGWNPGAEGPARALQAWTAVADAVWTWLKPPADGSAPAGPGPIEAFALFEAWYADAFGRPFLALLDQEPLEIPVVEG